MKGKDKCEFLKGIRKRMAELNGIPYEPRECTYEGDCTGTCPFCEKEAAELLAKLRKKVAEGAEIQTDDFCIEAINIIMHREPDSLPDNMLEKLANPDTRTEAYKEWESLLIEQETKRSQEPKQLRGSLVNTSNEDIDLPLLQLSNDLTTVNRINENLIPFIVRTGDASRFFDEEELRKILENSQPLKGDISVPYEELSEEEKKTRALLQEEMERAERERKRGIFGKILANIKRTSLQGLIDEEE